MFFLAFATQYFADLNSTFWFKESEQATTKGFPTTIIISESPVLLGRGFRPNFLVKDQFFDAPTTKEHEIIPSTIQLFPMHLIFAFVLFPLVWIPIALATATIVLPGFQVFLPAALISVWRPTSTSISTSIDWSACDFIN